MVVGVKKTIQQVPSRGRISIMRIQHFTVERRQSVIRAVYGALLLAISAIIVIVDPLTVGTDLIMRVKEGSFLFKLYEKPPYQLYCEVWIFNYTNVPDYLNGKDKQLHLQEVGPFLFKEARTNENMTVDPDAGVMNFIPRIRLSFIPEQSVSHYRDVDLQVPNIALVAMSTLFADKLGYVPNVAAYYSMKGLGSKLFLKLNGEELLWGYKDPVVTLANTFLPGWIDFDQIGIMDRFYADRTDHVEVELQNSSSKFSINSFNNLPGLKEQGYIEGDDSTLNLCNTIRGSYEGLMVTPPLQKDKIIPFFRRQACRIIPIEFYDENTDKFGFNTYRYRLQDSTFNKSNPYSCPCNDTRTCLPDGFVDVSNCYYGFPIAISKPHFVDTDPKEIVHFKGMKPDPEKYRSVIEMEPTLGVPLSLKINIQVNVAVRMSPGNTITKPLADKIVPLLWLSLYCKEPPGDIVNLLRLRLVIAPPLVITIEVILFIIGFILGIQGFRRILKPKYRLIDPPPTAKPKDKADEIIPPKRKKSVERRLSTVILNMTDNIGFNKDDDELAKQAVSLLAITEEDNDMRDFLIPADS